MPASRFTRAAIGTLYPGSVGLRMSAATPPDEMQIKSIPSPFSALAIVTASSGGSPPSLQSLPVVRAPSGIVLGTTARTARAIDNGKRMRFSNEPPYWSVRLLEIGDMKQI